MDDLIYRQGTINEIESLIDKTAKGDIGIFKNRILKIAIEHIQKMPSAQRWIPCSERLPKEDEYVLATTVWGEITMAENLGNDEWFIHEGDSNAYTEEILAWMPLPQPWKGM